MKDYAKHLVGALTVAFAVTFFFGVPLFFGILESNKTLAILTPIMLFILVFVISMAVMAKDEKDTNRVLQQVDLIIKENSIMIAKESLKKTEYTELYKTNYGKSVVVEKWIYDFLENIVKPNLCKKDRGCLSDYTLRSYLRQSSEKIQIDYMDKIGYYDYMSGVSFELFCKNLLLNSGWIADTTKKSGDQGVDLIASKNGIIVALQCKKYQKAVGNRAVQEIIAGAQHYGVKYPIVVTNSTYTRQAEELSKTTGVLLLHFSELDGLYNRLVNLKPC